MDLLNVTTTYREMVKKYGNFRAPTVEITVGGTKLVSGAKMNVTEVEVELSCEGEASGCVFHIAGEYKPKNTNFSSDIDRFQIGETVQVELGYIRLEKVFSGYINQVDYDFNFNGKGFAIRVDGIDAKGLLMKNQRMEISKENSVADLVNKLLGEQPVSSYLEGKSVDSSPKKEIKDQANTMNDYDLISDHASKIGYEFFISQGKAHFRPRQKNTSPVIKLSPKHGIFEAKFTLSGQQLFKTAEARAVDDGSGKKTSGKADIVGKFSKGGTAEKMMGPSKQVFQDADIKDTKGAQAIAENKLVKATESFGALELNCVGIPEIGPARFIELEEMSEMLNRKYYVTSVSHKMNDEGYRTTIKARVSGL